MKISTTNGSASSESPSTIATFWPWAQWQGFWLSVFWFPWTNPIRAAVSFYLQRTLGGGETLRGFSEYRFRDENQLFLAAEYRWEALPALEFAAFWSGGKVFAERADFDFSGLQKSVGLGVRLKTPGGVLFRVDTGFSREGTQVYLRFRPSF